MFGWEDIIDRNGAIQEGGGQRAGWFGSGSPVQLEWMWWGSRGAILLSQVVCLVVTLVFFFDFLGLHPWHMEVPRLGIKSELQPSAYITATAMQDPS